MAGLSRRRLLVGAAFSAVLKAPAIAQIGPLRSLRLVVPAAPGSVPDILARTLGDALSVKLGQAVIVDNKVGAGGALAMQDVVRSRPDGTTLALATASQAVYNPYIFSKLPYNARKDLQPVSRLVSTSFVLAAHPSIDTRNFAELIERSKLEAGRLLLGVPANGAPPHVAAALMMQQSGLMATVVPFRGGPTTTMAAIRGDVQLVIDGPTLLAPHVQQQTLRAIVATGSRRPNLLPDVMTVREAGHASSECESWMGLFAPAGTPEEATVALATEIERALQQAPVTSRLQAAGFTPSFLAATPFARFLNEEHAHWAPVLQRAGIKADQ